MTYAQSPGWRLCGTVSCPESYLTASSGVSAGCRTSTLALRPYPCGRSAGRTSSPFLPSLRDAQAVLCTADALRPVVPAQGWQCAAMRPRHASSARFSCLCSVSGATVPEGLQKKCSLSRPLVHQENFASIFPFTQREAKAEGEPKSLWQASSAPRCLAFAWPEACEGKTSQILSSLWSAAVCGMRRPFVCMCRIAGRAGSF